MASAADHSTTLRERCLKCNQSFLFTIPDRNAQACELCGWWDEAFDALLKELPESVQAPQESVAIWWRAFLSGLSTEERLALFRSRFLQARVISQVRIKSSRSKSRKSKPTVNPDDPEQAAFAKRVAMKLADWETYRTLTRVEAAVALGGVHQSTVRRYIEQGLLQTAGRGQRLVLTESVNALLHTESTKAKVIKTFQS
jgi:hypothetical protein